MRTACALAVLAAIGCEAKTPPPPPPPPAPPPAVSAPPQAASPSPPPSEWDQLTQRLKANYQAEEKKKAAQAGEKWESLFDGKSLGKWDVTKFGGEGEVKAGDGQIVLEMGTELTGVHWTGEYPRMDYEIALEAMRVDGHDFFCCLVFPVQESYCSFVVGGWGGSVVGLSCLDGMPAAENETAKFMSFDKKKWYPIRLRVTKKKIEAWIEKEQVVDVETEGRKISLHPAIELSKPLGLSTWSTVGALRDIRLRRIP